MQIRLICISNMSVKIANLASEMHLFVPRQVSLYKSQLCSNISTAFVQEKNANLANLHIKKRLNYLPKSTFSCIIIAFTVQVSFFHICLCYNPPRHYATFAHLHISKIANRMTILASKFNIFVSTVISFDCTSL